jgi:hypothetical protein
MSASSMVRLAPDNGRSIAITGAQGVRGRTGGDARGGPEAACSIRPAGRLATWSRRLSISTNGVRTERISWGTSGSAVTNVHGEYRIYGLMPGDYYVRRLDGKCLARTRQRRRDPWAAQPIGPSPPRSRSTMLAPTIFREHRVLPQPSPSRSAAARSDSALICRSIRARRASFRRRHGSRWEAGRTRQRHACAETRRAVHVGGDRQTRTDAAGAFTFSSVPPGDYVLTARGGSRGHAGCHRRSTNRPDVLGRRRSQHHGTGRQRHGHVAQARYEDHGPRGDVGVLAVLQASRECVSLFRVRAWSPRPHRA